MIKRMQLFGNYVLAIFFSVWSIYWALLFYARLCVATNDVENRKWLITLAHFRMAGKSRTTLFEDPPNDTNPKEWLAPALGMAFATILAVLFWMHVLQATKSQ